MKHIKITIGSDVFMYLAIIVLVIAVAAMNIFT